MFDINNILINLKIISQIKLSDKLGFHEDHFIIEESDIFQAFIRWKNGETRNLSISHIEKLLNDTFIILDKLINKDEDFKDILTKYFLINNIDDKKRLDAIFEISKELSSSLSGLNNLRKTYYSDNLTRNKIDLLIDKINYKINQFND